MSADLSVALDADGARELVDGIVESLTIAWDRIVDAYKARVWEPLGYTSWDALCATEFASLRLRLPAEERAIAVQSLRAEGLSTRAIAAATGVSKDTVNRVPAPVSDETPAPVTGQDGKTYASTRPTRRTAPAPAPPQHVPPPETWPNQPAAQVDDELAARRAHADNALAEADRQRQATDEFNAATAHLVPQADRERPYGLAAIRVGRAVEALPLDMDPGELAAYLPRISAHHLDQLPAAADWINRLITARREAVS